MKKPRCGTDQPRAFVIELGLSWSRWAKARPEPDLQQISERLKQLQAVFGKPHLHAGLGIRRLSSRLFEFRVSRELRVLFLVIKPNIFRLMMCGSHDEVCAWLKENT